MLKLSPGAKYGDASRISHEHTPQELLFEWPLLNTLFTQPTNLEASYNHQLLTTSKKFIYKIKGYDYHVEVNKKITG